MAKVYLALYKGRKDGAGMKNRLLRLSDRAIRLLTRGMYSHCEIAIKDGGGLYRCFSASARDGGVRAKTMSLPPDKWDLIPVLADVEFYVVDFYKKTKSSKYDYIGIAGLFSGIRHHEMRWFCSEWCGHVLGINEPWRFTPNQLAAILKSKYIRIFNVDSN